MAFLVRIWACSWSEKGLPESSTGPLGVRRRVDLFINKKREIVLGAPEYTEGNFGGLASCPKHDQLSIFCAIFSIPVLRVSTRRGHLRAHV